LYHFEVIIFSVKDPGGTIFSNDEFSNPDVCSLLQEIDMTDNDTFTLVSPKAPNQEASFLNLDVSDVPTLESAKKQLAEVLVAVETAKQALIDDNSNIRFRGSELNKKMRSKLEEELKEQLLLETKARTALRAACNTDRSIIDSESDQSDPEESEDSQDDDDDIPDNDEDFDIHGPEFDKYWKYTAQHPTWTHDTEIKFYSKKKLAEESDASVFLIREITLAAMMDTDVTAQRGPSSFVVLRRMPFFVSILL
jgi:hypothetical protein